MWILGVAGVWFAFIVACLLGVAFLIAEVVAQQRYEQKRKAQKPINEEHD